MSTRAHDVQPVVVRCLPCHAAVDRSVADTCPFCGADLAPMPLLEPAAAAPAEPEPARESESQFPGAGHPGASSVGRLRPRLRAGLTRLLAVAVAVGALTVTDHVVVAGPPTNRTRPPTVGVPVATPNAATPVPSPQTNRALQYKRAGTVNDRRFPVDHDSVARSTFGSPSGPASPAGPAAPASPAPL